MASLKRILEDCYGVRYHFITTRRVQKKVELRFYIVAHDLCGLNMSVFYTTSHDGHRIPGKHIDAVNSNDIWLIWAAVACAV